MHLISGDQEQKSSPGRSGWDFLTNHAHVLMCVAHYEVVADAPLRHPLVQEREAGDLLEILIGSRSEAGL